jgi:hypothetical protein
MWPEKFFLMATNFKDGMPETDVDNPCKPYLTCLLNERNDSDDGSQSQWWLKKLFHLSTLYPRK